MLKSVNLIKKHDGTITVSTRGPVVSGIKSEQEAFVIAKQMLLTIKEGISIDEDIKELNRLINT